MDKLLDYICGELEGIEKKAEKGNLSMSELQFADTLAHLKKNLLKSEEMEMESEYSQRGYTNRTMPTYYGNSYAGRRNARRDSMGRYSRTGYAMDGPSMARQLRDMMEDAPDDQTRMDIQRLASKLESM